MTPKAENHLRWLNAGNETGIIQLMVMENLIAKFPNDEIIGLEIGSAYGGGVEAMARLLKGRGKYYGYDTFEGHPRDLAVSPNDLEATCMDMWYSDEGMFKGFGKGERLTYEYQRKMLDDQGLDNGILVKGRINPNSFDDIKKAHFAILDLDMIGPMKMAYELIKNKIVIGGYLFIHDAVPEDHLPMINIWAFHQVLAENTWKVIANAPRGNLLALERWKFTTGMIYDGSPKVKQLIDINER